MKFCVFGSINIDIFFSVPHIAGPGETLSAQSVSRSAGGKGANQAAALASAGCDVFMAGKIGADGRWILHILGQSGVNTDYTDTIDGYTGQAVIQVDQSGENSIILYSGGNGTITRDYVDSVLSHFQPGDVLLVQNETSRVPDMIRRGKERGMTVCCNLSPFTREAAETYPLEAVDFLFVNVIEGRELAGVDGNGGPGTITRALADIFPESGIVLTAGSLGSWYARGGTTEHTDAIDTSVVDTTGAGDTFTGFFLAALLQRGLTARAFLIKASEAAAATISRKGTIDAMPSEADIF